MDEQTLTGLRAGKEFVSQKSALAIIAIALVFALAACAAPAATPTAAPISTLAATVAPTATPLPATAVPTSTTTLAPRPTATRTLSPQESLAASLNKFPFPGFAWHARGDAITLTDAKGTAVAVLDTNSGGIKWTGDFGSTLNPLLTTDTGKAQLVALLKANPDLHFLTYPAAEKNAAPYAVTLLPDGKSIALVQGFAGTKGYEWHKEAKALAATSEGNQAMYFLDSAGKWQQCVIVKDGAKENAIFGADWGRWIWDKDTVYPDNWQFAQEANEILSAMKAHPDFYPAAVRDNLPWLFNMKNKDISNTAYFAWIENHITDKSFAEKLRAINDPIFRLMAVNTEEKITITNDVNRFNLSFGIEISNDLYFGGASRLAEEMTHARQPSKSSSISREVASWLLGWQIGKQTNYLEGANYRKKSLIQLRLLPPYLPY